MLIKIGDVTEQFGISHKTLHYWENAGIIKATRMDNEYRYYDEDNLKKIKKIVLLRKLQLPIISIQSILESDTTKNFIRVLENNAQKAKEESTYKKALVTVIQKLINILKDRQEIENIYNFLDINHIRETEELMAAFKIVFSEPIKEPETAELNFASVGVNIFDLELVPVLHYEADPMNELIKSCFSTEEARKGVILQFDLTKHLNMPDCRYNYKILQEGELTGIVQLEYIGYDTMLIKYIALKDSSIHVSLFEALKRKYPQMVSWHIRAKPDQSEHYDYDHESKKQRFWEDNGFTFFSGHRERNTFAKWIVEPETYVNNPKYRYGIYDGTLEKVAYRMCNLANSDIYDTNMKNSRFTDTNLRDCIFFDMGMTGSRYVDSGMDKSEFSYIHFENSKFKHCYLNNVQMETCDLTGFTIDGINVQDALNAYKENQRSV